MYLCIYVYLLYIFYLTDAWRNSGAPLANFGPTELPLAPRQTAAMDGDHGPFAAHSGDHSPSSAQPDLIATLCDTLKAAFPAP